MYTNMTNIIVRLSCGPECDKNAVLLNAHYDTTLGSPGAVDDALPIGVMMELIRILSQRPALKKNSLIFCKISSITLFLSGAILRGEKDLSLKPT
jgi:hypothetical protein